MKNCSQYTPAGATENMSSRRFYVAFAVVFLTLCVVTQSAQAGAGETALQSHRDIESTAERAVAERLPATSLAREIRAQPVDSRLQLSACSQPLRADLPGAFARGQRLTVAVQCAGAQPWKIYVPVDVHETVGVLVAARSLARDAVLSADDVLSEERALSGLQRGYLSDSDIVAGLRLKRSVRAGQVLTPAHVASRRLVRRGQQVTLVAAGNGLKIAVDGVALSDGILGQRIKVRNMSSKQEVEGVVRSEQNVEILLK